MSRRRVRRGLIPKQLVEGRSINRMYLRRWRAERHHLVVIHRLRRLSRRHCHRRHRPRPYRHRYRRRPRPYRHRRRLRRRRPRRQTRRRRRRRPRLIRHHPFHPEWIAWGRDCAFIMMPHVNSIVITHSIIGAGRTKSCRSVKISTVTFSLVRDRPRHLSPRHHPHHRPRRHRPRHRRPRHRRLRHPHLRHRPHHRHRRCPLPLRLRRVFHHSCRAVWSGR